MLLLIIVLALWLVVVACVVALFRAAAHGERVTTTRLRDEPWMRAREGAGRDTA
jgi:hypothetical protein